MIHPPFRSTLAALIALAGAADAAEMPQSFAVRLSIAPTPGSPMQRIVLPARVLAALRHADLGDLRVFDARGRTMQIALAEGVSPSAERRITLPAYPILGSPGALKAAGLSLTFDGKRGARIVGIDGGSIDAGGGKAELLGALLDARALTAPVTALTLDADVPASQPVTFTIEASPDLADWRPLATKVIFRNGGGHAIGGETIALDGVDLAGSYLRVTWRAGSRLLSPVAVRGAVVMSPAVAGANRARIDAIAPPGADPHRIGFTLPFGLRPAALRIVPAPGTAVIPIRLFGRDDRERPWVPLGTSTVYRIATAGGGVRTNGAIELADVAPREIRIEADTRTPGFATSPTIEFYFAPHAIVALLAGTPPFVLAAGSADAASAYLPIGDLVPGGRADGLPAATPDAGGGAAPLMLTAPSDGGTPRQTLILWAALLLGTLALGGVVWALYRGLRAPAEVPPPA